MFRIIDKQQLTPLIYSLWVEAPRIAASAKPGQFLIVRTGENGERIPLTICDYNPVNGTVRIVVQIAGVSSNKICHLNVGDCLTDVAGPLGKPSDFMVIPEEDLKDKRYLFVAGGVGAAPVYPQAKYLHERGAYVDVIIGARNKDLIIMADEMRKVCTNLYICTDDGSQGEKGVVTLLMERLCATAPTDTQKGTMGANPGVFAPTDTQNGTEGAFPGDFAPTDTQKGTMGANPGVSAPSGTQNGTEGAFPGDFAPSGTQNGTEGAFSGDFASSGTQNGTEGAFSGDFAPSGTQNGTMGAVPYDMCVAIGPMIMMKFATLMAKKLGLPITVSLNTLMVDGTGMCGACRVSVAGKTMFACVDGPEFNGYDVDFDEALRRQTLYRTQEQEANAAAGLDLRR